jgi:hypothetical protein
MKHSYSCHDGTQLPFKEWYSFNNGFSIMPMKTKHRIRHDATNEIHKPPNIIGPGNDRLMMALYKKEFPIDYATYCFGHKLVTETLANH